jgi:hypothetical protein
VKIRVTLKDPDGIYECITDALKAQMSRPAGCTIEEWDDIIDARRREITDRWFKYGDYAEIEIDTDGNYARILSVKEQA